MPAEIEEALWRLSGAIIAGEFDALTSPDHSDDVDLLSGWLASTRDGRPVISMSEDLVEQMQEAAVVFNRDAQSEGRPMMSLLLELLH